MFIRNFWEGINKAQKRFAMGQQKSGLSEQLGKWGYWLVPIKILVRYINPIPNKGEGQIIPTKNFYIPAVLFKQIALKQFCVQINKCGQKLL